MSSKRYTEAFKVEAVKQVTDRGHSVGDVAGRLGISVHSLYAWRKQHIKPAATRQSEGDQQAELRADDERGLILWRAFARRIHYRRVLAILGDDVLMRIQDRRLGRERRNLLLSSVVIDALYALLDDLSPAIAFDRIQQALRAVDADVRAESARMLQRFVATLSGQERSVERLTTELLFDRAIGPFLRRAWPSERSLATRGVSRAFADLPVSAGNRMPAAVEAIGPFLMSFDCWSMYDYGFRAEGVDGSLQFEQIDTADKARALLKLLDATIGLEPDAIIPRELGDALERISHQSPSLSTSHAFRRLAVLARRR